MESLIRKNIERTLGAEISPEMFTHLKALSFEKTYDKNEYLVEAGSACNYQFFIIEGLVFLTTLVKKEIKM